MSALDDLIDDVPWDPPGSPVQAAREELFKQQRKARQHTIEVVVVFMDLMHARECGRRETASLAATKLRDLGVEVRFVSASGKDLTA